MKIQRQYEQFQYDPKLSAARTLANALSLPLADQQLHRLDPEGPASIHFQLQELISPEVADNIWKSWHPDQVQRLEKPAFRKAFRQLLLKAVGLGYDVERFRNVARNLPDPEPDARNWIPAFEETIMGKDRSGIRLFLNTTHYNQYLSTPASDKEDWKSMFNTMYDGLFYELGIIYPSITIYQEAALAPNQYRIEWNDLKLPPVPVMSKGKILVNDTVERLKLILVQGEATINPANGSPCAFVAEADQGKCERAGLTTWNEIGYIILSISSKLRQAAPAFVNRYLIDYYLQSIAQVSPFVAGQFEQQKAKDLLTGIIRGLLAEQISVRDLSGILNAILKTNATIHTELSKYIVFAHNEDQVAFAPHKSSIQQLSARDYVEKIRRNMRRFISHKYTRGQSTLIVYLLDPELERLFLRNEELDQAAKEQVLQAVRNELGALPPSAQNPVVLTTMEVRYNFWKLTRVEFPYLACLAYQELSPDMNIQPIARISLS